MKAAGSTARCSMRVLSPRIEPPLRLEEGSTARTATRWPLPVRYGPERVDERRLAHARHPRHPDALGVAGAGQEAYEQLLAAGTVLGPPGLDQGDGPADGRAVGGEHPGLERVEIEGAAPGGHGRQTTATTPWAPRAAPTSPGLRPRTPSPSGELALAPPDGGPAKRKRSRWRPAPTTTRDPATARQPSGRPVRSVSRHVPSRESQTRMRSSLLVVTSRRPASAKAAAVTQSVCAASVTGRRSTDVVEGGGNLLEVLGVLM